jgi:MFS family permease
VGGPGTGERLLTREFFTVGLAAMLCFAAMGAASPVLPLFIRDELGGSDRAVGFVAGSMAISAIAIRPFLGRLGDRRGLRILIVLGTLLSAVGFGANALVDSMAGAVVARLFVGAGQAALITGAVTLVVNLAPLHRRGEATSYVLTSFHLGLGLGPLAGELLLDATSFDTVWLTLGGISAAGALVATRLPYRPGSIDGVGSGFFHAPSVRPGLVMTLGIVAFGGFQAFIVLFSESIGMDRVAPVFMLSSITVALVRVCFARLPDRLGPVVGSTVALALMGAGLFLVSGWQRPAGLFAATFLMAAGSALLFPSLTPAAVDGVPESRRASALATFTLFIDIGGALGAPLFGIASSATSYGGAFLVGGAVCVLGLVYLHTMVGPHVGPREAPLSPEHRIGPAVDSA